MKRIQILLSFLCLIFNAGCTSTLNVFVQDNKTKEPIENAYVYVLEFAMFSPFNSSNIYLTDKEGKATISQNIKEGNIHIFAGKEGYELSLYKEKLYALDSIDIGLNPNSPNTKSRLKKIQIREKLFNQYDDNLTLRNFMNYCKQQNIEIIKIK